MHTELLHIDPQYVVRADVFFLLRRGEAAAPPPTLVEDLNTSEMSPEHSDITPSVSQAERQSQSDKKNKKNTL